MIYKIFEIVAFIGLFTCLVNKSNHTKCIVK